MSTENGKVCGIIMPISSIDNCSEHHWTDVLKILTEAIEDAEFKGELVSESDDSGIIQQRIISNLYDNPIVVCDVSGKNPNVMFELGMRLAFDKPTIIIKDDQTAYSFDTSSIEHLEYPRDLRFSTIVNFKKKLTEKIIATYTKSTKDENYTTFLKHFGEFKVAKIDKKEISGQEFIIKELELINRAISKLEMNSKFKEAKPLIMSKRKIDIGIIDDQQKNEIHEFLMGNKDLKSYEMHKSRNGEHYLILELSNAAQLSFLEYAIDDIIHPVPF